MRQLDVGETVHPGDVVRNPEGDTVVKAGGWVVTEGCRSPVMTERHHEDMYSIAYYAALAARKATLELQAPGPHKEVTNGSDIMVDGIHRRYRVGVRVVVEDVGAHPWSPRKSVAP